MMRGFFCPDGVSAQLPPNCVPIRRTTPSDNTPGVLQFPIGKSRRRNLPATLEQRVEIHVSDRRCSVKGCVFPATSTEGNCVHHARQYEEPSLFCSRVTCPQLLYHFLS